MANQTKKMKSNKPNPIDKHPPKEEEEKRKVATGVMPPRATQLPPRVVVCQRGLSEAGLVVICFSRGWPRTGPSVVNTGEVISEGGIFLWRGKQAFFCGVVYLIPPPHVSWNYQGCVCTSPGETAIFHTLCGEMWGGTSRTTTSGSK